MTAAPALLGAETVIGSGQMTSGASATGGGGGGVGALGVLLHPAPHISASSAGKTRRLRRVKVNRVVVAPGRSMHSIVFHVSDEWVGGSPRRGRGLPPGFQFTLQPAPNTLPVMPGTASPILPSP